MTAIRRALLSVSMVGSLASCSLETHNPTSSMVVQQLRLNVTAWVDANHTPLADVEPGVATSDLAALANFVGSMRVVAMGDNTHGAHEAFTTAHRTFRFLVEQLGFTGFAIEGSLAEAFAIDTYVRTGRGDPRVLLSHLYAWSWNAAELLDLIEWLRVYNAARSPEKRVGFYGFDMQYPGAAMDSVVAYVARTTPLLAPAEAQDYECLADYRNDDRGISRADYSKAREYWSSCSPRVGDAYNVLIAYKSQFEAASSPAELDRILRYARTVVQWEAIQRGQMTREAAMSENVVWLLQRDGAQSRLFLWGHGGQIARVPTGTSLGRTLASTLITNYLPIGFAFGSGSFNALRQDGTGNATTTVQIVQTPAPRAGSYEEILQNSRSKNFLIDLRAPSPNDVTTWLAGPEWFRSVGASFNPDTPDQAFQSTSITRRFDVVMFVRLITPSKLLPFVY